MDLELLKRAGQSDLDGVKRLIQQNVDVNTTDHCNQTALYRACEKGHTEVAQYLLDSGASVDLGEKPLIAAVANRHYDCAKLLLQHDADVNYTNTEQESPMSIALKKQHYSLILLLLQHDAIPSASLNDVAYQLISCAKIEDARTIQKLIDENYINLTSERLFRAMFNYAFKRGSEELAEKILSYDFYSEIDKLYAEAAYYCARNNWSSILAKLVEKKKFDINAVTDYQTPLYAACEQGYESIVSLLLENGADPKVPNTLSHVEHMLLLPLEVVVQHGNLALTNMLLDEGAQLDQPKQPLLHTACSRHAAEKISSEHILSIIRLLLQRGINVNAVSNTGDTALYCACASQLGVGVVHMLLEAGADVNLTSNRRYPLIAACSGSNVQVIHLLLKAGADVKCKTSCGETCLHNILSYSSYIMELDKQKDRFSISDTVNVVKLLVESGVDVNASSSQEETALYLASRTGNEDVVKLLLEAGAKADGSSYHRPLHYACEHGYIQIVDLLLQHGADPNAFDSSLASLPICCSAKKGYADIINLLMKHGADVSKPDISGKTALIHTVELLSVQRSKTPQDPLSEERDIKIMKCILLTGGNMNQLSQRDGLSALHIASSSGMCDVMMELIQNGANCNQLTSRGKSALDLACEKGHEAAVELLLESGAKPDTNTETKHSSNFRNYHMPLLCTAVKNGSETMVKLLVKHGANVNAFNENGNTALHLAKTPIVTEMLLNAEANVNATNNGGETALSVVCKTEQADANIVELLLKFGSDPNICFPLHAACKNNKLDVVQLLLAHGADANAVKASLSERLDVIRSLWIGSPLTAIVKNTEPSPLCLACKNGNITMADYLLKNGADVLFADGDGNTALHFAIERISEQANSSEYDPMVTFLLQHDVPVNVLSYQGETPLYLASMKGLEGVVKQLLDCRADAGLTTTNSNKYPLLVACERKFRNVAMMLLERGADANVMRDKQTPLKAASANGDITLVKELLSHGADVNQMQNVGDTALHVAVVRCKGRSNEMFAHVVQKLLKGNADPNALNDKHETPLYLACRPTNDEVNLKSVQTLLEHGADPNICPQFVRSAPWFDYELDDDILPPLMTAARCGNTELVTLLIKFGAKVDHITALGRTALHYAAFYDDLFTRRLESSSKSNYTSTAKILLSAGAEVNLVDRTGAFPLYLACKRGQSDLVELLINHGANPNTKATDKIPLHAACSGLHCDSVRLLIEHNADVSARDSRGQTALHCALESEESSESAKSVVVQQLLDADADVNAASQFGTPLYVACSSGLVSIVVKMLERGAKVNEDSGMRLPLHVACRNKHLTVVKLLLSNGADPNVSDVEDDYGLYKLPLHIAAADGNSELVELLLENGANVDGTDDLGNTALHRGIERYHPTAKTSQYSDKVSQKSVFDILLENGADVNIANDSGETALYKAATREQVNVVRKMLQTYGGNPNKDTMQKNPLVVACERRNAELVDALLQHGADPNLPTKSCRSDMNSQPPLCTAASVGNCDAIIVLLLKAGASVNARNSEGKSALLIAINCHMTSRHSYHSFSVESNMPTVHILLEHGADVNLLMPDGRSLLNSVVTTIAEMQLRRDTNVTYLSELLQLMVKHGAILSDSFGQRETESNTGQPLGMLKDLATFDYKHEFITVVELFKAGAGFQLTAKCCKAVATIPSTVKSIRLCQAVVVAGYMPSAEELQDLQSAAAADNEAGGLLDQLLNWVNEDKQKVPSLLRQSRVAIRRQLSFVAHCQTILPAIDKLPLPNIMKLYLQFEGSLTEIDLSINKDLQTGEKAKDTSSYDSDYSDDEDYDYVYNSSEDEYEFRYYGSDSDDDEWRWG